MRNWNKNLVNLDDLNRVTRPRTTPLDESFDLKIRWRHEIFKIKVKPEDLMTKVLDHVAKKSGISVNDINVYIDENSFTPLAPTASVKSLRINVASVLNARAKVEKKNITSKTVGDGSFEIKLQTKDKKQKPVMIRIKSTDSMGTVIEKYCEQTKMEKTQVKLFFDGEMMQPDMVASDFDLEGGECVDVHCDNK